MLLKRNFTLRALEDSPHGSNGKWEASRFVRFLQLPGFSIATAGYLVRHESNFMRSFLLPAALFYAPLTSASALTQADITPAALVGKTFSFTIKTAGGSFARVGSWTGTFGSTSFTVANSSGGNTAPITTTYTTTSNPGSTTILLPSYIAGSGPCTIYLASGSDGSGNYELNFDPVGLDFQIGTFNIATVAPKVPEIDIQQPVGSSLTDSISKVSFGTVKAGKVGASKQFLVLNSGAAKLSGLVVSKSGKNASDFTITGLKSGVIGSGDDAPFKVTFKPKTAGIKNAVINIRSNDKDESPFTLRISGAGLR